MLWVSHKQQKHTILNQCNTTGCSRSVINSNAYQSESVQHHWVLWVSHKQQKHTILNWCWDRVLWVRATESSRLKTVFTLSRARCSLERKKVQLRKVRITCQKPFSNTLLLCSKAMDFSPFWHPSHSLLPCLQNCTEYSLLQTVTQLISNSAFFLLSCLTPPPPPSHGKILGATIKYTHTHTCAHTHTHTHMLIYAHTHTHQCTLTHTCMHTDRQTNHHHHHHLTVISTHMLA